MVSIDVDMSMFVLVVLLLLLMIGQVSFHYPISNLLTFEMIEIV